LNTEAFFIIHITSISLTLHQTQIFFIPNGRSYGGRESSYTHLEKSIKKAIFMIFSIFAQLILASRLKES